MNRMFAVVMCVDSEIALCSWTNRFAAWRSAWIRSFSLHDDWKATQPDGRLRECPMEHGISKPADRHRTVYVPAIPAGTGQRANAQWSPCQRSQPSDWEADLLVRSAAPPLESLQAPGPALDLERFWRTQWVESFVAAGYCAGGL